MNKLSPAFAEVVESSLASYTAHCWEWNNPPRFGSLIGVEQGGILLIGVVTEIITGSTEESRSPFPYKKTLGELERDHPHIFAFFKTTFTVTLVGHYRENTYYAVRPTQPPLLHSFVAPLTHQEELVLLKHPDHLPLLSTQLEPGIVDEIMLTNLIALAHNNQLSSEIVSQYCETLSLISGNEYRRLKLVLQRLRCMLPEVAHMMF